MGSNQSAQSGANSGQNKEMPKPDANIGTHSTTPASPEPEEKAGKQHKPEEKPSKLHKPEHQPEHQPPAQPPPVRSVLAFHLNDETRRWIKENRTPVATSIASVTSTLVAYPLDFVKARMQSYNAKFGVTFRDAWKHEGISGMYKGSLTPIYTIALVRVISFSIYQKTKHLYNDFSRDNFGVSPLEMANAVGLYPNIHTVTCFFLAGCAGGAVIPVFAGPFELLKLKSQLAGKMARDTAVRTTPVSDIKTGTWRPAWQMIRERGFFSLWKGFGLHMARDTIGTAVYFSVYEALKQTLSNARGYDPTDPRASMIAGGLCGMASWIIIYPIDVIKTQYQKRFLSREPLRPKGGFKLNFFRAAGYRGLGISMIRSGVINALFFPIFETGKTIINSLRLHGGDPNHPGNSQEENDALD